MKYYALLDNDQNVLEFGVNEVHLKNRQGSLNYKEVKPLPQPLFQPSQFAREIAPAFVNGVLTQQWEVVDKSAESYLEEVKEQFNTRVMNLFDTEVDVIKKNYKQSEIDSWNQQKTEAEAYVADNTTPTPLLSAMATARGITVALLATNIMVNVNNYRTVFGAALGKKQGFEDQLDIILANDGLTTQEKIDAILAINIV